MRTVLPMRTPLLAVIAPLLAACPSAATICRSGVDQVCERSFECQPEQVRASAQFQGVFGTGVDDCKTKLYANPLAIAGATGMACDQVTSDAMLCANLGIPSATQFDLGKAQDCRDARKALSCELYLAQLQDPSKAPPSCAERCK